MATGATTQAELDAAIAAGMRWFVVDAPPQESLKVTGSVSVVARDAVRVEAWNTSHVVARDAACVTAGDSCRVEATERVTIRVHSPLASVEGGVIGG